jgi:hypothetical protein
MAPDQMFVWGFLYGAAAASMPLLLVELKLRNDRDRRNRR